MSPPRNDNTRVRRFCKPHLRKLFWDENIWVRYFMGELDIEFGALKERDMVDQTPFKTHIAWCQQIKFRDRTGKQVCRAHVYLSDDLSIAASGAPDPKEMNWNGINTHIHSDGSVCELCAAGDVIEPDYEDQQRMRESDHEA